MGFPGGTALSRVAILDGIGPKSQVKIKKKFTFLNQKFMPIYASMIGHKFS
jgi:hypothetical protein